MAENGLRNIGLYLKPDIDAGSNFVYNAIVLYYAVICAYCAHWYKYSLIRMDIGEKKTTGRIGSATMRRSSDFFRKDQTLWNR